MSDVLKHFWQLAALVKESLLCPRKCCLNCPIPAEVKSSVLSPVGISESDGTTVHPLFLKNPKNSALIFDDSLSIMLKVYQNFSANSIFLPALPPKIKPISSEKMEKQIL
jgi:hypothetical protein